MEEEKKCIYNTLLTKLKEKIKSAFGEPNKGIHSYRICNIAYMDVLFTFIGAYLLQKTLFPKKKYTTVLFYLFITGIIMHRLFNVSTTVDSLIFGRH